MSQVVQLPCRFRRPTTSTTLLGLSLESGDAVAGIRKPVTGATGCRGSSESRRPPRLYWKDAAVVVPLPYPVPGCLRAPVYASSTICRLQMPETTRLARMLPKSLPSLFQAVDAAGSASSSAWHSFCLSLAKRRKKKRFSRAACQAPPSWFLAVSVEIPLPSRLPIERSMCKNNLQGFRAINSRWPCRRRTRIGGENYLGRGAALLAGSSRSFVARVALLLYKIRLLP